MALSAAPQYFQLARHGVEGCGSEAGHDAVRIGEGGAVKVAYSYLQDQSVDIGPFYTGGFTTFHCFATGSAFFDFIPSLLLINPATMAVVSPVISFALLFDINITTPEWTFGWGSLDGQKGVSMAADKAFALRLTDNAALSSNGTLTMWAGNHAAFHTTAGANS
jgi:hypothetical protein